MAEPTGDGDGVARPPSACSVYMKRIGVCLTTGYRVLKTSNILVGSNQAQWCCVMMHFLQLMATVIIFLIFFNKQTVTHVWWPALEAVRISIITAIRIDRLLRLPNDRNRYYYIGHSVVVWCNIFGFVLAFPFWIVYIGLLPNAGDLSSVYALFSMFCIFSHALTSTKCCIQLLTNVAQQGAMGSPYRTYLRPSDAFARAQHNEMNNFRGLDEMNAHDYIQYHSDIGSQDLYSAQNLYMQEKLLKAAEERKLREKQDQEYHTALQLHKQLEEELETMETGKDETEHVEMEDKHRAVTFAQSNSSDSEFYETIQDILVSPEPELPPENDMLVLVRFRLPDGSSMSRKFLQSHTVEKLYQYVESLRMRVGDTSVRRETYSLMSNFPKACYMDYKEELVSTEICRAGMIKSREGVQIIVSPVVYIHLKSPPESEETQNEISIA